MTDAQELAAQVLSQDGVLRWMIEYYDVGNWRLAGFIPADHPKETPGHAVWRFHQIAPHRAVERLRAEQV